MGTILRSIANMSTLEWAGDVNDPSGSNNLAAQVRSLVDRGWYGGQRGSAKASKAMWRGAKERWRLRRRGRRGRQGRLPWVAAGKSRIAPFFRGGERWGCRIGGGSWRPGGGEVERRQRNVSI